MGTSVAILFRTAMGAWRPPPRLSLSEWADSHFMLSAESAAEPGRWRTLPYQRAILDAFSDPDTEQISVMKSARVGWTKCLNIVVAYYMAQDPCPIMVVQPTIEDAEGYSKEEVAPMIRDVDVLSALIPDSKAKDSGQTLLHKAFRGGSVSMTGANSGRGFRRVSRKVVLFDEVDGYPPSAGTEGDQIKLGIRRTEYYWDRKIGAGSTPLLAGASRIEDLFEKGDQRRYYVPCPHCGHMDYLVFRKGPAGHYMAWPDDKPEAAYFVCSANGCVIDHDHKREMVEAGEWRAGAHFNRHASFHIWAAYSFSPNASWGQIATEFVEATKEGPEALKTFVNTVLGETWQDRGEAPDWLRIYQRRESYGIGKVPAGVAFLTAGIDVQKDRLVYEVVGWGDRKESWSVEAGVLPGDTSSESSAAWKALDELLARSWLREDGQAMGILITGVDAGYNTQVVYNWCRRHPMTRVIACKGVPTARVLIGTPSKVDVTVRGKKLARGYRVWPIGVNVVKSELYAWLRLELPTDESEDQEIPGGYCHFPEYGEEFFKQLTAEHLVPVVKKTGFTTLEWQIIPGRENHFLDCRVYARAAASLAGLDRSPPKGGRRPPPPPKASPPAAATPQPPPAARPPAAPPPRSRGGSGWLAGGSGSGGRGGRGGRGGWLNRR